MKLRVRYNPFQERRAADFVRQSLGRIGVDAAYVAKAYTERAFDITLESLTSALVISIFCEPRPRCRYDHLPTRGEPPISGGCMRCFVRSERGTVGSTLGSSGIENLGLRFTTAGQSALRLPRGRLNDAVFASLLDSTAVADETDAKIARSSS